MIDTLRISHVAIRVRDLEKAYKFYVDLLGLVDTEKAGEYLYLRGIEEGQHHSLVLKRADSPGLSYIGIRVKRPEELEKAKDLLSSLNLKFTKHREKGVDDGLLFETPQGIPLYLYYDMEYVGDLRMKFFLHRGVSPVRLAHVNLVVGNLETRSKVREGSTRLL